MPAPDLRQQAADFAQHTNDLLNRTVAQGVRVRAVLQADEAVGWVGYEINRHAPYPGKGIPLTVSAAPARSFLHVMHTLVLDPEGVFLAVEQSTFGLYLEAELGTCVFHYDYVRKPDNPYPPAHLQVEGESAALQELFERLGRQGSLPRLHFPVGGKRYRPSLEDVVELLVVEGLAKGRPGWEQAVNEHRSRYYRLQLMAAVRRDPEAAQEVLRQLGL